MTIYYYQFSANVHGRHLIRMSLPRLFFIRKTNGLGLISLCAPCSDVCVSLATAACVRPAVVCVSHWPQQTVVCLPQIAPPACSVHSDTLGGSVALTFSCLPVAASSRGLAYWCRKEPFSIYCFPVAAGWEPCQKPTPTKS